MALDTISERIKRRYIAIESRIQRTNIQLIGLDTFYGAPGEASPLNDTMLGSQVTTMRRNTQASRPALYWQNEHDNFFVTRYEEDRMQTLLNFAPPDDTQFGTQVVRMRFDAGKEKQYLHAQSDIYSGEPHHLSGQDTIYDAPGQQRPLNDMFGEQVQRMRRRAFSEKQYVHATSDNRWGYPIPLLGQDRIYGGPGKVPTVDWTQFGPPRVNMTRPDMLRSVSLRWHITTGLYVMELARISPKRGGEPRELIEGKGIEYIGGRDTLELI